MNAHAVPIRPGAPLRGVSLRECGGPAGDPGEDPPPAETADHPSAEAVIAGLLESIVESVNEIEQRRRNSLMELQEVAVELAIAAASRVVRTALEQNQFGVDEIVRELVERVGVGPSPVCVLLHPEDLRLVSSSCVTALQEASVEIRGDPGIPRGSCRAVTGSRAVVSDWRTHLHEIRAALHEELEHAQIERRGLEAADQRVKRFPDRRETA